MNLINVQQTVRELFRVHYRMYPEKYKTINGGHASDECSENISDFAIRLYRSGVIEDIEAFGVTKFEILEWCFKEFFAQSVKQVIK